MTFAQTLNGDATMPPASGPFLFVSHVREDHAAAVEIVDELERRGVRCWIAPRDVRAGSRFDDEIADAIEGSMAMLLVFSEHCNESEYIHREVTVASKRRKIVIPFRIEDVEPRRGLSVLLSDLHWIDGFVARERALDDLARSLFPDREERQERREEQHEEQPRHDEEKERRPAKPASRRLIIAAGLGGATAVAIAAIVIGSFRAETPRIAHPPAPPVASADALPRANTTYLRQLRAQIPGTWQGAYSCRQGDTGVRLELTRVSDDGEIDGTFAFYNLPGQGNAKPGKFSILGIYNASSNALEVDPVAWVEQPPGYSMVGFNVIPSADWSRLSGRVYTTGCSEIELRR